MTDVKELLERLDALRAKHGEWHPKYIGPEEASVVEFLVALVNAYPLLRAALLEMREERDAERLRYGQQQARNAVFMQALAALARRESAVGGMGNFVRDVVERADRAAEAVRLEDFTTLAPISRGAKGGDK